MPAADKIRFPCPQCRARLSAPFGCEGRTSRCPHCAARVTVPFVVTAMLAEDEEVLDGIVMGGEPAKPCTASPAPVALPVPVALAIPEVLPVVEVWDPLTPCTACRRSIAKEALTCPQCGAPNKWVHPEIVRFYASLAQFDFEPSVQLTYEKFVLCGIDQQAHRDAESLANLANSFRVIAPLNVKGLATLVGVNAGQAWMSEWARKKVKAFRIAFFASSPPLWSSTDDYYWTDVMRFFGVPRPKKRRRVQ